MTKYVSADFDTLMHQAGMTAGVWLDAAIKAIDRIHGEGYAKKNPGLVSAFISASASDYGRAMDNLTAQITAESRREAAEIIANAFSSIQQGK